MRLAFLGTPDFSVPSLAALIDAGHDIAAVYSQPPAARGRGKVVKPTPVQAFAQARGLAVRTPASLRGAEAIAAFRDLTLDAAVVVAFGQILPADLLEAPRLGSYNLHASALPRWRGAAPIQRAIMAGDPTTAAQVMRMTAGLDEGPVLGSRPMRIDALDTAGSLAERLSHAGAALMAEVLDEVERGVALARPQAADGVTYARKIRPAESRLRWDRPAAEVDRRIRGLSPFPGAWFPAPGPRGGRIKALLSRAEAGSGPPGETLDDGLLIACGEGAVRILEAQREGRGRQEAHAFLRGFPIPAGTAL
ncbi:MAG: methionyl-tRNA formyltransferase [Caulobacteraceae bacterium]|nr:methionyl-tRNA formyltransferase [Caulobacteraceae bacterium]